MDKLKYLVFILVGGAVGFFIGMQYQSSWHTRTDLNLFCGEIGKQYLELVKEERGITTFDGGGDWEKAVEIETQMINICNSGF